MEKLYLIATLIREQKQRLDFIDQSVNQGLCNPDEALDAVFDVCEEYNGKIKTVLNEPVKISHKQFMDEQAFHGTTIN